MEEPRTRTLVLPDSRGGDRFLRVTWHPASSTVVFSHWTGSICTASTPVTLDDASRLVELFVGALRGLAKGAISAQGGPVQGNDGAVASLLRRLRRGATSVTDLSRRLRVEWDRRATR